MLQGSAELVSSALHDLGYYSLWLVKGFRVNCKKNEANCESRLTYKYLEVGECRTVLTSSIALETNNSSQAKHWSIRLPD